MYKMFIRKIKYSIYRVVGMDPMAGKYLKKYKKYAFHDDCCYDECQLEASITRLYHTVEKGMAFEDFRAGFGAANISHLIMLLGEYAKKYDIEAFSYKTALSVLNAYIEKNEEHGHNDAKLKKKIAELPGAGNSCGGVIKVVRPHDGYIQNLNYADFVKERHSIRQFSEEAVDLAKIQDALKLAQYTPSACNRQGWNTYVIADKTLVEKILKNQNGNRGFGQEIDKLLIVTFDLRYSNSDREVFQGYIDGGMYAMSVLNSLFFEGIASVPLSASLSEEQDMNVRALAQMKDSEVLVLFIGIGNYPEECLTTRSERREAGYVIV